jgi:hypothetical protein
LHFSAIIIKAAYPCKSISTGEDEVNVEMDPESEIEIRKQIEESNLRVVGWYHSHPNFPPHPSIRDIENQNAYQKLFVDEANRKEPFVGAIFGTYDPRMPSSESIVSWFYVDSVESKGQPYQLSSETIDDPAVTAPMSQTVKKLVHFYSTFKDRTHFGERWRFNLSDQQRQALADHKASSSAAAAAAASSATSDVPAADTHSALETDEVNLIGMEPTQPAPAAPIAPAKTDAPAVDPAQLVALAQAAQVTRLQKMLESVRLKLSKSLSEDDSTFFLSSLQSDIESFWFSAPISSGDKHRC